MIVTPAAASLKSSSTLANPVTVRPSTVLEHRRLPAGDDDRVEALEVEVAQRGRVLEQARDLGRVERAHRDQVVGAPARLVAGIAERVDLDPAALGRRDRDVVALLGELVERVEELGGPEADGQAGRRRGRRVGDDDQDAGAGGGRRDVDDLVMGLGVLDAHRAWTSVANVVLSVKSVPPANRRAARERSAAAALPAPHASSMTTGR